MLNGSNRPAFMWQKFWHNHFGHPNRFQIYIRGYNWEEYQYNFFLFYPYRIIEAISKGVNLRLLQKAGSLDTFLNKLGFREFNEAKVT